MKKSYVPHAIISLSLSFKTRYICENSHKCILQQCYFPDSTCAKKKIKSHHECEDFSFFSFQKKSSSWAERIWHSVLEKARWNATYSAKWWVWEIGWWKNACMGTKVNNFHNYSRESKRATRAVENAAAAGCSRDIER